MKKKQIIIGLAILIVLGIAAILIFLAYTAPQKATLPSDQTGLPSQTASTTLKAVPLVSEKEEGKYDSIDLSYPDTSAAALSDIKKYVDISKSDFMSSLPTSDSDAQFQNVTDDNKYTLTMTTKVYTSSSTITYKLETYNYTGGAHGNTAEATFTYGKDGKLINLNDILTSSDSLNKLSLASRIYLKNKFQGQLTDEEINMGTEPKADNFNVWYITDSGINFIFGQYQVGPYAIGIQEFPLSWDDAKGIIKL